MDLSEVQLTGLENSVVDIPQRFKGMRGGKIDILLSVDWSKSGGSAVDIKISSPRGRLVAHKMKQLKLGLNECTFTPTEPGLYLVDVFVNGIQLPG